MDSLREVTTFLPKMIADVKITRRLHAHLFTRSPASLIFCPSFLIFFPTFFTSLPAFLIFFPVFLVFSPALFTSLPGFLILFPVFLVFSPLSSLRSPVFSFSSPFFSSSPLLSSLRSPVFSFSSRLSSAPLRLPHRMRHTVQNIGEVCGVNSRKKRSTTRL